MFLRTFLVKNTFYFRNIYIFILINESSMKELKIEYSISEKSKIW